MLGLKDLEVKPIGYLPKAMIEGVELGPDVVIALEGLGTFKGVTLEERLGELRRKGKDLGKVSYKIHKESTRRGHSSIATSLILQFEVARCSRAASMLLVAPPFGSYLQESQRRRMVERDEFFAPETLRDNKTYLDTIRKMYDTYRWLVEHEVELEDARYILPLASKTSLFASGSLETFIGLIKPDVSDEYYPEELRVIGETLRRLFHEVSPMLTQAREEFENPLPTYPYTNPYKPHNKLMEKIIDESVEPGEPRLLDLMVVGVDSRMIEEALSRGLSEASGLNSLIQAVFLESLSLAAYHQSIRHRTIPTAVESIYTAVDRAMREGEKWAVVPPKIKGDEGLAGRFSETFNDAVEGYQKLIEEGARFSEALYLLPQSLRIYVVRTYNAFNLLWPQGYVGMRTCSYAQWEERANAYGIWRAIESKLPELASLMGEKCRMLGYCPEKSWCPIILKYHRYDEEEHRRRSS